MFQLKINKNCILYIKILLFYSQVAWTIIRFEIHHLWNPDWTYAFPQQSMMEAETVYDENNMEEMENGEDQYGGADYYDPLLDEFSVKDGGRIPLLKMTYINISVNIYLHIRKHPNIFKYRHKYTH